MLIAREPFTSADAKIGFFLAIKYIVFKTSCLFDAAMLRVHCINSPRHQHNNHTICFWPRESFISTVMKKDQERARN